MAAEGELLPRITKVWAKNFRSIEYAELELDALTVLVGPNASGKSNLLDILSFLGDAAKDGLESAITNRGGMESIGRRRARGRAYGPEIGLQWKDQDVRVDYSLALSNDGKSEYRVKREFARYQHPDPATRPLVLEIRNGKPTKPDLRKRFGRVGDDGAGGEKQTLPGVLQQLYEEGLGNQELTFLNGNRVIMSLLLALPIPPTEKTHGFSIPRMDVGKSMTKIRDYLRLIGSYRLFPNSLRDPQKMADSHPLEEAGGNLTSTLRDMIRQESRFLPDLKHALAYAVQGVSDIRVKRAASYLVVEIKHEEPGRSDRNSWFDLSYESDGTLRLLGMLVALFQEPSPSLIGIEEPESTIHPGALAVLADTMQEAALRGQVLVTTHSPDLINLLPIECFRAVTAEGGTTKVGKVSDHQIQSVKEGLFLAGELHSMEGLQVGSNGDQL